jgi:regulator of RNase E activity RraA
MRPLSPALVEALQRLDACSVSNAIETFDCRLRNEGFADGRIRAMFDELLPVVGHAVTARVHCATPPDVGHTYYDRTDWWEYIRSVPSPRVVVLEDADQPPGAGAFVGEIHACIFKALGCVACVTNGAVRDVTRVRTLNFQLFAQSTTVSHAYAHIVEFGVPVVVGGLRLGTGDIVYGDRHGVLTIPDAVVSQVPAAAERILAMERNVVTLCMTAAPTIEQLRAAVREL